MISAYEENGVFPTKTGDNGESDKLIRCHYRPRSSMPAILFALWSCFCLPLIFNSLKWFLGSGLMSLAAGLLIFGMSMNMFVKLKFLYCFSNLLLLIFTAASFIYKLIDITLISRGSSYGTSVATKENKNK